MIKPEIKLLPDIFKGFFRILLIFKQRLTVHNLFDLFCVTIPFYPLLKNLMNRFVIPVDNNIYKDCV